ncbi:MAG: M1 family metallopeptidase, partial [Longimicrobiales bacterium]
MRMVTNLMMAAMTALPTALAAQALVADTSPFRPLDLPAPNMYRTGSGRPGPQYWQQRVDYRIDATLDVERYELRGRQTIRYTNYAPQSLNYLWLHVEQNICAPGSVSGKLNQPPLVFQESVFDFSCKGFRGGFTLQPITSSGRALPTVVDGTVMRVDLPMPLASGSTMELELGWSFLIPEYGAGRMGRDGPLYEIAQWYPRVAVFDDVRGWNHEPYVGAGEFYLEYGRYDVTLTVPATYIVAATGQLMNPEEVLTATQRERLTRARSSEQPVAIIAANEIGQPASRPRSSGTLTWRFQADSVRDFAFAAAPNWRWDASGYNGILIHTLYRANAPLWTESNRMARAAIQHFSETWLRYPYAQATAVEGLIEGMEYPMLVFVPKGASREDLHWVLSHEFGHFWYPMIVGANERLYPWMDEGFNSFVDIEGAEKYFAGSRYADTVGLYPLHLHAAHSQPGDEQPMINRPIEIRDLFW